MKFRKICKLLSLVMILALICMNGLAQKRKTRSSLEKLPNNIILMIGDGMGVAQVYSGLTVNHGQLNLTGFKSIGFSKTYSATDYTTDSGAGATALSTGNKTYNYAIGVDKDSVPCKTILEYAEEAGLSTGLVSTSSITHATPAAFIAHQPFRDDYEAIAADFLKTDIDVFIGGGRQFFSQRKDQRDLLKELRQKGYQVVFSMDSIQNIRQGKLAGLNAPDHNPAVVQGRGDMLPRAAETAINILSNNKKGFFLMVEGSHIDWGGHANNADYVAREVIDFDNAIGKAMEFAQKDGNTLVIVTADHETGGLVLLDGSFEKGTIVAKFATTSHSGTMVPVFAWGPGAENFQGIQENTEIFGKMMSLLKLGGVTPNPQE
jgi:alkaline phosphatase